MFLTILSLDCFVRLVLVGWTSTQRTIDKSSVDHPHISNIASSEQTTMSKKFRPSRNRFQRTKGKRGPLTAFDEYHFFGKRLMKYSVLLAFEIKRSEGFVAITNVSLHVSCHFRKQKPFSTSITFITNEVQSFLSFVLSKIWSIMLHSWSHWRQSFY